MGHKELEAMGASVKRIVISGYYGYGNSGDEAVLQSILNALAGVSDEQLRIEPIVLSANPDWTSRTYGVRAVHRMKPRDVWAAVKSSNGLISGGGSLLQDATSTRSIPYYIAVMKLAQWLGKPTFVYSQGIGPVHRRIFYPMIRNAFKNSAYVSVRDTESAELLVQIGLKREEVEIVPDPVMGMNPHQDLEITADSLTDNSMLEFSEGKRPVLGISVRHWNKDQSELKAVAEALHQLREHRRVHLRFLPFYSPHDHKASLDVLSYMGVNINSEQDINTQLQSQHISIVYKEHPQAMQAMVASCSLLVGMRLHSLIYAASQYIPIVGISYDPKINHFLRRLDLEPAMTTESPNASQLLTQIEYTLDHIDEWRLKHSDKIKQMIEKSLVPAQQIRKNLRIKG
jgi:polysaccharide pyruvyl transferase CsaB